MSQNDPGGLLIILRCVAWGTFFQKNFAQSFAAPPTGWYLLALVGQKVVKPNSIWHEKVTGWRRKPLRTCHEKVAGGCGCYHCIIYRLILAWW